MAIKSMSAKPSRFINSMEANKVKKMGEIPKPKKNLARPSTVHGQPSTKIMGSNKVASSSRPLTSHPSISLSKGGNGKERRVMSPDKTGVVQKKSAGSERRPQTGSSTASSVPSKTRHPGSATKRASPTSFQPPTRSPQGHSILAIPIEDITTAFNWYSRDSKVITKDDIKVKVEHIVYPTQLVPLLKDIKNIMGPESAMTLAGLKSLCTNRRLLKKSLEEAFHLLEPENKTFPPSNLYRILSGLMGKTIVVKYDLKHCIQEFDVDGDGAIGIEDFKAM